ncbi:MAG TPA: hypothetical protein PKZ76_18605 [Xanthomonadaceae bacterium]|nr:hypothetical protein [Xanthomonadaceae bacterium]
MALALVLPVSAQTQNLVGHDLYRIALANADAPVAPAQQALMDQWRGYALNGITPQFRWSHSMGDSAPPSLMSRYSRNVLSVLSSADRDGARRSAISVAIHAAMAGETPAVGVSNVATGAMADGLNAGLQRVFVTPSFTQTYGEGGSWTLTGILAHQRFASMGMGSVAWSPAFGGMIGTRHPRSMGSRYTETSVGTGARLELVEAVNDRLSLAVALQSKLDMDSFKFYRGVYSDAGDFDVPGHAAFGTSLELRPGIHLGLGVQRVFFSDIAAFTSAALPVRFLALLGDASSPEFAWEDLTVYSATMSWQRTAGETWSLRYTTRQQPAPTSPLLRQALEPEFTNNNFAMAFSKDLGRFGQFLAAASYAPKQYFLATGPFTDRANPGRQQREFEAHWGFQF